MSEDIHTDDTAPKGISRRDVLKRGAVIGGALWAAPTIQSLTNAASAHVGSPLPFHFCCQCQNAQGQVLACEADGETVPAKTPEECRQSCIGEGAAFYSFCHIHSPPDTLYYNCTTNDGCVPLDENNPQGDCTGITAV